MITGHVLLLGPRLNGAATGARVCFEMLLEYLTRNGIDYRAIDISGGGGPKTGGTLSAGRIVHNLGVVARALFAIPVSRRVYLVISLSAAGALRDCLIMQWAAIWRRAYTVHLHGGGYATFLDACPALLRRVLIRRLAGADRILVLSGTLRGDFDLPGVDRKKIRVTPNGLPPDDQTECEARTLPDHGAIKLLYLSNMIETKGYLHLVAACRILLQRGLDRVECHFCGAFPGSDPAREAEFLAVVEAGGLSDHVTYHGSVHGAEKAAMFCAAHLLVLPTRYPGEGQPMAIIEALSAALPVVATAWRTIPELLADGACGVLVNPDDTALIPDRLATAIESAIGDPQRYAAMSVAARAQFVARFQATSALPRLVREGRLDS